jgi:hypothetical protein
VVTQLIPKFRCNPWSDSGDRARGSWGLTRGLFFWKRRSNRPGCFQVEVVFRRIFLCEFVRLDQRSVCVKFGVVLVPFARCS